MCSFSEANRSLRSLLIYSRWHSRDLKGQPIRFARRLIDQSESMTLYDVIGELTDQSKSMTLYDVIGELTDQSESITLYDVIGELTDQSKSSIAGELDQAISVYSNIRTNS